MGKRAVMRSLKAAMSRGSGVEHLEEPSDGLEEELLGMSECFSVMLNGYEPGTPQARWR